MITDKTITDKTMTENSLKKFLEKPAESSGGRRGRYTAGFMRSRVACFLAEGFLAALLCFALAGCDGVNGMSEDIKDDPDASKPFLGTVQLELNRINPSDTLTYSVGDDPPEFFISASLKNASGLIRFDLYSTDQTDTPLDTKTEMPLTSVKFTIPASYLDEEGNFNKVFDTRFYVTASYPSTGPVLRGAISEDVLVSVGPNFEKDSDKDGFPDSWENANSGEKDGEGSYYNPGRPNKPYGIDLSAVGMPKNGVSRNRPSADTPVDTACVYTVTGDFDGGDSEYLVYYSNPDTSTHKAGYIVLNAPLDTTARSCSTVQLDIASDVKELHLKTYGESGGSIFVKKRSDTLTIYLDGVTLKGGAPIDFEVDSATGEAYGQQLKVFLTGTNTLTAGSDYSFSIWGWYPTAGIHVPAGASLTIDSADFTGELEVTGATGTANNGGAGIGGSGIIGTAPGTVGTVGNITISGGKITATGGANAAGIGGGNGGPGGTITIDANSSVKAKAGSGGTAYAVGPGADGDDSSGSFSGPNSTSGWQNQGGTYTWNFEEED